MTTNKKYGLILPDKQKPKQLVFQASRNVFGNDSDSEDERTKKRDLVCPTNVINRKTKNVQEKAVSEDPTVYQYDEIYDSMTSNEKKLKSKSDADKKPRYVENLLRTAKKRKIENEQRIEKQIQKEREKEGDEFADKEIFVTSAYKKKLEELRLEEEKERHEEYLEKIGDVTKQADLSGFSRFLYQQKLGNTKNSDTNVSNTEDKNDEINKKEQVKRNYRKRKSSESKLKLSEGEIEDSDEEINRVNLEGIREAKKAKLNEDKNLDADSDFMDESSEDDCSNNTESIKNSNEKENHEETCSPKRDSESLNNKKVTEKLDNEIAEKKEPELKIDIWKKRTVGEIFEQALQRYYERKKTRGC